MTYYIECKEQTNAAELECLINSGEKYKATQEDCLVKFEKIESMRNLESDYERGMREAMKDIAKSCGKTFAVDIGYLDLPKLVDSLVNKEKSKPRTKVVYEPVNPNEEGGAYWECARDLANGVEFASSQDNCNINDNRMLLAHYENRSLCRVIEKEIDWRDEVIEFVGCGLMERMGEGFQIGGVYFHEIVIRDIAHFVQPITDKPE